MIHRLKKSQLLILDVLGLAGEIIDQIMMNANIPHQQANNQPQHPWTVAPEKLAQILRLLNVTCCVRILNKDNDFVIDKEEVFLVFPVD